MDRLSFSQVARAICEQVPRTWERRRAFVRQVREIARGGGGDGRWIDMHFYLVSGPLPDDMDKYPWVEEIQRIWNEAGAGGSRVQDHEEEF